MSAFDPGGIFQEIVCLETQYQSKDTELSGRKKSYFGIKLLQILVILTCSIPLPDH